jgi:hypothetical protein
LTSDNKTPVIYICWWQRQQLRYLFIKQTNKHKIIIRNIRVCEQCRIALNFILMLGNAGFNHPRSYYYLKPTYMYLYVINKHGTKWVIIHTLFFMGGGFNFGRSASKILTRVSVCLASNSFCIWMLEVMVGGCIGIGRYLQHIST